MQERREVKLRLVLFTVLVCFDHKKKKEKQQHRCCFETKPHKSSPLHSSRAGCPDKRKRALGPIKLYHQCGRACVLGQYGHTLFFLPNPPNTKATLPPTPSSSSNNNTPTMASRIAAAAKGIRFASHAHASAANPWLAERIAIKEHAGRMFVYKPAHHRVAARMRMGNNLP